jgi:hypothetical protein
MISAATFRPVKLAPSADGDFHVDVNIGPAAATMPTPTNDAAMSVASMYLARSFFIL